METISYFVVWILEHENKDRYLFTDINVETMDSAIDIHDKIFDEIQDIYKDWNITIKHVSFLKSSK